jgi:hypothetical protein
MPFRIPGKVESFALELDAMDAFLDKLGALSPLGRRGKECG